MASLTTQSLRLIPWKKLTSDASLLRLVRHQLLDHWQSALPAVHQQEEQALELESRRSARMEATQQQRRLARHLLVQLLQHCRRHQVPPLLQLMRQQGRVAAQSAQHLPMVAAGSVTGGA